MLGGYQKWNLITRGSQDGSQIYITMTTQKKSNDEF